MAEYNFRENRTKHGKHTGKRDQTYLAEPILTNLNFYNARHVSLPNFLVQIHVGQFRLENILLSDIMPRFNALKGSMSLHAKWVYDSFFGLPAEQYAINWSSILHYYRKKYCAIHRAIGKLFGFCFELEQELRTSLIRAIPNGPAYGSLCTLNLIAIK